MDITTFFEEDIMLTDFENGILPTYSLMFFVDYLMTGDDRYPFSNILMVTTLTLREKKPPKTHPHTHTRALAQGSEKKPLDESFQV